MRQVCTYIYWLGVILGIGLTGCSSDELPEREFPITFQISTRATGDEAADMSDRWNRLFVAERLSEHTPHGGTELLHCGLDKRYDLSGDTYSLSELLGQWYKFAFFSVPDIDPDVMGENLFEAVDTKDNLTEHDFNRLLVNYVPLMDYQATSLIKAQAEDLSIYRKVIDRWVDPKNPLVENVELTRVTGALVLDMGIPADQFEKPVSQIKVQLQNEVQRLYLRDNSSDEVITDMPSIDSHSFVWPVAEDSISQHTRQRFSIALLPHMLEKASVTVEFYGGGVAFTYKLQNNREESIRIQKNKRTLVLFNGIQTGDFEIRYAGFDDKADIDVDTDDWDGWQ